MPDSSGAPNGQPRRPKMRDVATLAKVSMSTVSRVVNGAAVDAAMKQRVQEAIELLGYHPHVVAGDLRRANPRSKTVGFIVPDIGNPFFSTLQRGVEDILRGQEILLFASSTDESPERQRKLVDAFAERAVSGLLVVPTEGNLAYLERLRDRGIQTVFVDRPSPSAVADLVTSDNRSAARRACEHLIEQGHTRIAMLGGMLGLDGEREIYTTVERRLGYEQALERHGLSYGTELVRQSLRNVDAAEVAIRDLVSMAQPTTAIFTSHNFITLCAARALRKLGLHRQIALVGFDDVDMAECSDPPLTVVAQRPREIGLVAAELLLSRMNGDHAPTRHETVRTDLILRGSGEIPPFAAPDLV